MPLTVMQRGVLALLAHNRTPDSYLAGGAALNVAPRSVRYTRDLDFFHDSSARVASAYSEDSEALHRAGYKLGLEISQPGFRTAPR